MKNVVLYGVSEPKFVIKASLKHAYKSSKTFHLFGKKKFYMAKDLTFWSNLQFLPLCVFLVSLLLSYLLIWKYNDSWIFFCFSTLHSVRSRIYKRCFQDFFSRSQIIFFLKSFLKKWAWILQIYEKTFVSGNFIY